MTESKIVTETEGNVREEIVISERTGVPPAVRAWGRALAQGLPLDDLEPEEALADLEIVSMFR